MKIELFSCGADYDKDKPLVFKIELPDSGHILDSKIVLGHKAAHLHLTLVHDSADKLMPMTLLGLLTGQEHPDAHEYEFVAKTPTSKFTSAVPSYFLFVAPRT